MATFIPVYMLDLIKSTERNGVPGLESRIKAGLNNSPYIGKVIFKIAQDHYDEHKYPGAALLVGLAHNFEPPSQDSVLLLADCHAKSGSWDDAYYTLLKWREIFSGFGSKSALVIERDETDQRLFFDYMKDLFSRSIRNCSTFKKAVTPEEYVNWHWNKRFREMKEIDIVAEHLYPHGSIFEVTYHPFEFRKGEYVIRLQGLTDEGVPFTLPEKDNTGFEVGARYAAKADSASCIIVDPVRYSLVVNCIALELNSRQPIRHDAN